MACVKCNGVWQCSPEGDPCDMSQSNNPIESEEHCFQIYTKKVNNVCTMRVKSDGTAPNGNGWQDAGKFCVAFDLFVDADTGACFVKVSPSV